MQSNLATAALRIYDTLMRKRPQRKRKEPIISYDSRSRHAVPGALSGALGQFQPQAFIQTAYASPGLGAARYGDLLNFITNIDPFSPTATPPKKKEQTMPLFEVAVIEHPTKKDREEGAQDKLVFGPKAIIAKDPQSAAIAAVMGEKIAMDPERIEVLIRPFA